jgi:2,4-dienoyl-CoA reductase-like NADH-dependent reductase (Old Yellow Enzyme family)
MQHRIFDYTSREEFLGDMKKLERGLPFSDDTSVLNSGIKLGEKHIKNRLLVQPMEGFDAEPDGSPGERTRARYTGFADGGSGTIWLESISVSREGRSNPRQLWLNGGNVHAFASLAGELKKRGAFSVAQLTHSGRYSNPEGVPAPVCAIHNPYIPKQNERTATDEELERLEDDYAACALLAQEAGFDAVDIRSCHGYLINELFAAYEREGAYGGRFENRVRFLLNIVDKIKQTSDIEVAVRLNVYDGVPYPCGWGSAKDDVCVQDMAEPMRLIRLLYGRGVRLLNISGGIGAYSPNVLRPYDRGGAEPGEHPLEGIERLLQSAKAVKKECPDAIVVASAFSWLRGFAPMVAAGGVGEGWFDIAGFGREALTCPGYANDILAGKSMARYCKACGGCSALIRKSEMLRCILDRAKTE